MYTAIMINRQGASETRHCDTKTDVRDFINEWADPENFEVRILIENDEVGHKPFDRKSIQWKPGRPKGTVKEGGRKKTHGITISDDAWAIAEATGNASAHIEKLILADKRE